MRAAMTWLHSRSTRQNDRDKQERAAADADAPLRRALRCVEKIDALRAVAIGAKDGAHVADAMQRNAHRHHQLAKRRHLSAGARSDGASTNLRCGQVDVHDAFGDRMLDLQTRIHLEEVKLNRSARGEAQKGHGSWMREPCCRA